MWSRLHALGMLLLCSAGAWAGHAWPLAAGAAVSFVIGALSNQKAWRGRFVVPNSVTALRSALTLLVPLALHEAPGWAVAAACAVIFALDGCDGWLARRLNAVSAYGARWDMEADAVFLLLIEFELWQRGRVGVWVIGTGLLRYAYVLCLALFPNRAGPVPRFALARHAFAILVSGLSLAWLLPDPWAAWIAAIAAVPIGLSFAYSFIWSYSRR